jgi:hypothetical protein
MTEIHQPPPVVVRQPVAVEATAGPPDKKKQFTFPTAYTVLFILVIVMAALTWIVPAGQYDRGADGQPIPGTL